MLSKVLAWLEGKSSRAEQVVASIVRRPHTVERVGDEERKLSDVRSQASSAATERSALRHTARALGVRRRDTQPSVAEGGLSNQATLATLRRLAALPLVSATHQDEIDARSVTGRAAREPRDGGLPSRLVNRRLPRRSLTADPGVALSGPSRTEFEMATGFDASEIRVHTDDSSARIAESFRANALTAGTDIFFGRGMYRPAQEPGRRLLRHELAHVVQQHGDRLAVHRDARQAAGPAAASHSPREEQPEPSILTFPAIVGFRVGPVPAGPVEVDIELEGEIKLEVVGVVPTGIEEVKLSPQTIISGVSYKLFNQLTVDVVERKLKVNMDRMPGAPELEVGFGKGAGEATIKFPFSKDGYSLGRFDLGDFHASWAGHAADIKLNGALNIHIRPNPALVEIGEQAVAEYAEGGAAAGVSEAEGVGAGEAAEAGEVTLASGEVLIINGAIVPAVAFLGTWLMSLITAYSRTSGEKWAGSASERHGFARRVAAAAMDWNTPSDRHAIEELRAMGDIRATREAEMLGWKKAEEAIGATGAPELGALFTRLKTQLGTTSAIMERIFNMLGGELGSGRLPTDLTVLNRLFDVYSKLLAGA